MHRASGFGKKKNTSSNADGEENLLRVEIVNEHAILNPNLVGALSAWNCDKKLRLISIMGPQSSGKSTLLNGLFHTNFDMMDARTGRKRCTNGLWIGNERGNTQALDQLLVLDVEGVDGHEKHDRTFENRATVFSLAMSSVLMINIRETDVGLHYAACIPLMEAVFTGILRLSADSLKEGKKLLFFILRDYRGITPVDKHRDSCVQAMFDVWAGISKPKEKKNMELSDLFDLEVYGLPDIMPDNEFDAERLGDLPEYFKANDEKYVFRTREGQRFDNTNELARVAEVVWRQVLSDKELNVAADRVLIAQSRCQETYDGVMAEVHRALKALREELTQTKGTVDLRPKAKAIIADGLKSYEENASRYDEGVFEAKKAALEANLTYCFEEYAREFGLVMEKAEQTRRAAEMAEKARKAVEEMEARAEEAKKMEARFEEEKKAMQKVEEDLRRKMQDSEAALERGRAEMERLAQKMKGAEDDLKRVLAEQSEQARQASIREEAHRRELKEEREKNKQAIEEVKAQARKDNDIIQEFRKMQQESSERFAAQMEMTQKQNEAVMALANRPPPPVIVQGGSDGGCVIL